MTGRSLLAGVCLLVVLLAGCVGGASKIPGTPDAVLARADQYFNKGNNVRAATLYQQFVERYAGHDRADYAQFMLAESHFRGHDYPVASIEYQVLISNYGYSEYVDDALFEMGVCAWRQSPRAERDQTKTQEALSRFNQYLQTYPDGPHAQEAKDYIRRINEKLAKKAYTAARWYYRQKNGKAAMIYCDKVIDDYPDNRYWAEALYLKGDILLRRGEKEEAIRQFTQVLAYPEDLPVKRLAQSKLKEARR